MMTDKIKQENKKAMPKFGITLLLSALAGGVLGFCSAMAGDLNLTEAIHTVLSTVLTAVTPWGIPVCALLTLGNGWRLFRQAKGLADRWDGEDEAVMDTVEEKLSWVLFFTTIQMLLDFFFLSAGAIYMSSLFQVLVTVVFFFLSIGISTILQQKTVDLERRLNPEKRGSIYDKNFHKVWMDSCDEAEQKQIGQASYKAFSTLNIACPVIWCALLVCSIAFDIGLLPSVMVLLVWGIASITYVLESIRLSKKH